IMVLERLASGSGKRRGRPPKWMTQARRRGTTAWKQEQANQKDHKLPPEYFLALPATETALEFSHPILRHKTTVRPYRCPSCPPGSYPTFDFSLTPAPSAAASFRSGDSVWIGICRACFCSGIGM